MLFWPWVIICFGIIGLLVFAFYGRKINEEEIESLKQANKYLVNLARSLGVKQEELLSREKKFNSFEKLLRISSGFVHSSKDWMPILLSLVIIGAALYIIVSANGFPDAHQKWAFGVVGTVIGYWFKK